MSSALLIVTLLAQSQFPNAFPAYGPRAAPDQQQAVGFGPRATADLDIWIATDPPNAEKTAGVLGEFGFEQATSSLLQEPGKIIRMGVPPTRIEF